MTRGRCSRYLDWRTYSDSWTEKGFMMHTFTLMASVFFRDCIRGFKNRHNDGRHRVLADICKQWAAYGYIMSGVMDVVPYDCQKRGISYKKLKAVAVTK